jgi:mono/diheme cytochrome c family protein
MNKLLFIVTNLVVLAFAVDPQVVAHGEQETSRECIACHSLRLVRSQRLSKAAWNRELDKMAGWGAKYADREAILEYLVANFSDAQPPAPVTLTQDGSTPPKP